MTAIFQSSASIRDRGFIASAICLNPSRKNSLNRWSSLSERNVSKLEYYMGGGEGGEGEEKEKRRRREGRKEGRKRGGGGLYLVAMFDS